MPNFQFPDFQEKVTVEQISRACNLSADTIVQNFVINSSGAGWHQYLGQNRSGPSATAIGLSILSMLDRPFQYANLAKEELYKSQFRSKSNLAVEGGWTFPSIGAYPITEATSYVIYGLIISGESLLSNRAVQKGVEWLKNNQNADGGWGSVHDSASRTYSTYWATCAVSLSRIHYDILDMARTWVKLHQNSDGGWGEIPTKLSTPVHTALGVLTLLNCGEDPVSSPIQSAIGWLYRNWNQDTMWESQDMHEEWDIARGSNQWDRVRIRHFQTQWVVLALLNGGIGIYRREVFRAINWIIRTQQPEGYWHHPSVGNAKSIWGVHDSTLVLTTFLRSFGSVSHTGVIEWLGTSVVFHKEGATSSFGILLARQLFGTSKRLVLKYLSFLLAVVSLLAILLIMPAMGFSWRDVLVAFFIPLVFFLIQLIIYRPRA
ncbi:MAG: hypothetical protein QOH93_2169 [Chloroflexia bacterium]|jgi:prenyltransferase beta subunit|nr:hypothetical protein [Chloroflexia bacterium]